MRQTFPTRFWAKVDRSQGPDGCWPWVGSLSRKRCGTQRGHVRYGRRHLLSHRVARWLQDDPQALDPQGYDAPMGDSTLQACHTCDTRTCCNPRHLYWGTRADNERDRRQQRLWTMAAQVVAATWGAERDHGGDLADDL